MVQWNDNVNTSLGDDIRAGMKEGVRGKDFSPGKGAADLLSSTNLMGEDGTLFGIKLDREMQATLAMAQDQLAPVLGEKLGDNIGILARNLVKNNRLTWVGLNESHAPVVGRRAAIATGFLTVAANPLANIGQALWEMTSRQSQFRKSVAPIVQAKGYSMLGSMLYSDDNEVTNHARRMISGAAMHKISRIVARSVSTLPGFWHVWNSQKKKIEQFDKMESSSVVVEGEIPKAADHVMAMDEHSYNEEVDTSTPIGRRRAIIGTATEKYTTQRRPEIRKELLAAIHDGDASAFKEFGTDPRQIFKMDRHGNIDRDSFNKPQLHYNDAQLEGIIDRQSDRKLKHELREKAKAYATHHDAAYQDAKGLDKNGDDKMIPDKLQNQLTHHGLFLGGSIVGGFLERSVAKWTGKKLGQAHAFGYIDEIREQLENFQHDQAEHPDHKPDPKPFHFSDEKEQFSFAKAVHKVFQQHQLNYGRTQLDQREITHFAKIDFSDDTIQKKDDSELTDYEVAIKHIAGHLRSGRMDAAALINLVGEGKIVDRKKDGKSFGSKARKEHKTQDTKGALIAEVDHQATDLRPNHDMSEEELSQKLAGYAYSAEAYKAAFAPGGLKGEERAFMFSLMDAGVPDQDELKKLTGLDDTEIKSLREQSQAHFHDHLSAAIEETNQLIHEIHQTPEHQREALMKKYHITEEEMNLLARVEHEANRSGADAADVLNPQIQSKVETTIANVMMEDPQLWQDIVGRAEEKEHRKHETTRRSDQMGDVAGGHDQKDLAAARNESLRRRTSPEELSRRSIHPDQFASDHDNHRDRAAAQRAAAAEHAHHGGPAG